MCWIESRCMRGRVSKAENINSVILVLSFNSYPYFVLFSTPFESGHGDLCATHQQDELP